ILRCFYFPFFYSALYQRALPSFPTRRSSDLGVSAEAASAVTLGLTEHFGIPVSTTHTITGSIIGVGVVKRVSAVRWGVTISLLWAWILTVPLSAILGGIALYTIHYLF